MVLTKSVAKCPFCALWEGKLIPASLISPVWLYFAPISKKISFCASSPSCPRDLPGLLRPALSQELQPGSLSFSISFYSHAPETTLGICRGHSHLFLQKYVYLFVFNISKPFFIDTDCCCLVIMEAVSTWAAGGREQRSLFVAKGLCFTGQHRNIIFTAAAEVWF